MSEHLVKLGLHEKDLSNDRKLLHEYINLKLMTLGLKPITDIETVINTPSSKHTHKTTVSEVTEDLITSLRAQMEMAKDVLPPVDQRLQDIINKNFPTSLLPQGCTMKLKLPSQSETFAIDRANIAFELATPYNSNHYQATVGDKNTRIPQGLLSNPKSDKRSTVGTFHVVDGNCKISHDKQIIPVNAFTYMLASALNPPKEIKQLPFTATQPESNQANCWTSVYLSPPVIPGLAPGKNQPHIQKNIEVRYFAPASFVANLGFVEQIFCNRGNPLMNDLIRIDPERYCGVTCAIILAPHLVNIKKKDCGLPTWDKATERERRDGMCYKDENELYNGGKAFKITWRNPTDGCVITLIADTYFGYSKKEIKTQISFTSNIVGFSQEEHCGGCYATPVYSWGRSFRSSDHRVGLLKKEQGKEIITHTFDEAKKLLGPHAVYDASKGYLIDKSYQQVIYLPENVTIELSDRSVFYKHPESGADMSMKIKNDLVYVLPNGYQLQLVRHPVSLQWMIIGTEMSAKFLFKPSSVSGAGKSELSKSVMDAVTSGPFFVKDWEKMQKEADEIINKDYSTRNKVPDDYKNLGRAPRHFLSLDRSLGNVIQLLSVDEEVYTPEYNAWLKSLDENSIAFAYLIKSRYRTSWGDYNSWKQQFKIDKVNGKNGYALKCQGIDVICNYLRVGQEKNSDGWYWRNFRLRQDFYSAVKFQNNDDIGCSLICSGKHLDKMSKNHKFDTNKSYKLTSNCEYRYFQRPDDACYPGIDKKCEQDLGRLEGKTFISNFEPVTKDFCKLLADDVMTLEKYSKPMQDVVKKVAKGEFDQFDNVVVSSEFRITDPKTGVRSNNVRYLQTRDEFLYTETKLDKYLMEIRKRLNLNVPFTESVIMPVDCYVPGRRLNTIDKTNPLVQPLAVYGPIHYQPIPLLMLEWITCLSGKSPSTTGSGSLEGCLSKGPFNNLLMSIDLNYACLALILGNEPVLTTAAGIVGHKLKVEHDITLILPEIICRMTPEELNIENLIKEGSLELVDDIVVSGKKVPAGILGYRITQKFVKKYFARIFDHVEGLFTDEFLRPEKQSMEYFVQGVEFIYQNIKNVVADYCTDGSYEELLPPLKTLFDIVKNNGEYKGLTLTSPDFLKQFNRDVVIKSDWYKARLIQAQRNEIATCEKEIKELTARKLPTDVIQERLQYVKTPQYLEDIQGSLGVHVFAE